MISVASQKGSPEENQQRRTTSQTQKAACVDAFSAESKYWKRVDIDPLNVLLVVLWRYCVTHKQILSSKAWQIPASSSGHKILCQSPCWAAQSWLAWVLEKWVRGAKCELTSKSLNLARPQIFETASLMKFIMSEIRRHLKSCKALPSPVSW